jgi:hypothetical protein
VLIHDATYPDQIPENSMESDQFRSDWITDNLICAFTTFQIFKEQQRRQAAGLVRNQNKTPCIRVLCFWILFAHTGGASRDRTDDPLLAKQVLSQLSYGPW